MVLTLNLALHQYWLVQSRIRPMRTSIARLPQNPQEGCRLLCGLTVDSWAQGVGAMGGSIIQCLLRVGIAQSTYRSLGCQVAAQQQANAYEAQAARCFAECGTCALQDVLEEEVLHRVGEAWDVRHRAAAEVRGKGLRIECCAHEHQAQVGPLTQHVLHTSSQKQ